MTTKSTAPSGRRMRTRQGVGPALRLQRQIRQLVERSPASPEARLTALTVEMAQHAGWIMLNLKADSELEAAAFVLDVTHLMQQMLSQLEYWRTAPVATLHATIGRRAAALARRHRPANGARPTRAK